MLLWKVLKVGGYLIFDNILIDEIIYNKYINYNKPIDFFTSLFRDNIKIIYKGSKLILVKISEYVI